MLAAERLRALLTYNPETGVFTWRERRGGAALVDTPAGNINSNGYRVIAIDYVRYRAHRLAWLYVHGCWPVSRIDHVNRMRDDNRFANLRQATDAENSQNRSLGRNSTSGYLGVSWCSASGRWAARIKVDGRKKRLGFFASPEEASAAYERAKAIYHPFGV